MSALFLLCLIVVCDVVVVFQVEWIPDGAVVCDGATHVCELLPLVVAHLGAFHRTPLGSVAVDSVNDNAKVYQKII